MTYRQECELAAIAESVRNAEPNSFWNHSRAAAVLDAIRNGYSENGTTPEEDALLKECGILLR